MLYLYLPGSCLLYAEVLAHNKVEVVQKERRRAQIWNLKIIQIQIQIYVQKLEKLNFEPKIKFSVCLKNL